MAGMEGVRVNLSGDATMSTDTDAQGNYRFTDLSGGSYTITPAAPHILFEPKFRNIIVNNRDVTGADFAVRPVDRGDINYDGAVDLADLIIVLQIMSGLQPSASIYMDADVDGDKTIGLEEAIFILQEMSGIR